MDHLETLSSIDKDPCVSDTDNMIITKVKISKTYKYKSNFKINFVYPLVRINNFRLWPVFLFVNITTYNLKSRTHLLNYDYKNTDISLNKLNFNKQIISTSIKFKRRVCIDTPPLQQTNQQKKKVFILTSKKRQEEQLLSSTSSFKVAPLVAFDSTLLSFLQWGKSDTKFNIKCLYLKHHNHNIPKSTY